MEPLKNAKTLLNQLMPNITMSFSKWKSQWKWLPFEKPAFTTTDQFELFSAHVFAEERIDGLSCLMGLFKSLYDRFPVDFSRKTHMS